jgi:hypothetical protein
MGRNLALTIALVFICLLAFLTVRVIIEQGIDVLVVVSLVILAMFGLGVVGALTTPPDD